jgi:hypothetical protein
VEDDEIEQMEERLDELGERIDSARQKADEVKPHAEGQTFIEDGDESEGETDNTIAPG